MLLFPGFDTREEEKELEFGWRGNFSTYEKKILIHSTVACVQCVCVCTFVSVFKRLQMSMNEFGCECIVNVR